MPLKQLADLEYACKNVKLGKTRYWTQPKVRPSGEADEVLSADNS